jgi:hypothetical protein
MTTKKASKMNLDFYDFQAIGTRVWHSRSFANSLINQSTSNYSQYVTKGNQVLIRLIIGYFILNTVEDEQKRHRSRNSHRIKVHHQGINDKDSLSNSCFQGKVLYVVQDAHTYHALIRSGPTQHASSAACKGRANCLRQMVMKHNSIMHQMIIEMVEIHSFFGIMQKKYLNQQYSWFWLLYHEGRCISIIGDSGELQYVCLMNIWKFSIFVFSNLKN